MRGHAAICVITLSAACLFPTPRERAMEEPDRFERFNALAELDSTEVLQAWRPISDPTASLPGTRMPMNPPTDLRARAPLVEQYLGGVAQELRERGIMPSDSARAAAWETQLHEQMAADSFSGWSIELWSEPRIDGGLVEHQIRCNVLGMSQLSLATVAPTLSIRKPIHDLRFDWFVATGDSLGDEMVIEIVKAHALKF